MKKSVALFVVFALLLTCGMSAFANVTYYESGVKITDIHFADYDENRYLVVVDYELDPDTQNENGISMMAYMGDNLSVTGEGFTHYDKNTMTILATGLNEQSAEGTGEFQFALDKQLGDTFTAENPAIVMVSGDDLSIKPAAAALVVKGDYKADDIAAIDEAVGDDTSDNVLAAAEEAKANINAAETKEASGEARDLGIAAINAAKQDNIDANFQIVRGGESGLEGVPTVQSLKYEDGTALMRFVWQLLYDTDIPITSIGSYTFNWDSFDKGATNAIVLKKNPEIENGWTFDADLTDITDFDESIRSIPMVNGIIFADSIISATVNDTAVN